VPELDGVWDVERTSGALPPMLGVRKRIAGTRGVTLPPGRMPGLPFTVEDGRRLVYRFPRGLVDEVEPDGDGFTGRAVLFGREVGRFVMRPTMRGEVETAEDLEEQLVKHIDEALAMEQDVLRMLDSMIETTDDEEIELEMRAHREQTEQHSERLRGRLDAHDASPSTLRQAGGTVGALLKGVVDLARSEKAGRNARDAYTTEHMEIAAYQLLERIATRAGDEETAAVARQNRAEEEEMARKLDTHWDRFAELSLREQGITA
jgi:ferritin-like metal-binding protein YciE